MDSMTTPESTEPRTAAQLSNEELVEAVADHPFFKIINGEDSRLSDQRYADWNAAQAELRRRLATITPTEPGRVVQLSELSDEELIRTAEQSAVMMRRDADALRRIAEKKWAIGSFDESRLLRIADRLDRLNAPTLPGRVVISVEAAGCAKRALDDYLMAADIDYSYDAEQDARDEIAVATAAAERAATGGA